MADRAVVRVVHDALSVEITFYQDEANLWRLGRASYLVMLARTATNKLNAAGAIGPYEFSCPRGDGAVNPHVFLGREIY